MRGVRRCWDAPRDFLRVIPSSRHIKECWQPHRGWWGTLNRGTFWKRLLGREEAGDAGQQTRLATEQPTQVVWVRGVWREVIGVAVSAW